MPASNCYALLVGIDKYLDNELPDGSYYRDLSGCVRDINHVERFLLTTLGVPSENITKLTASDNGSAKPAEPRELWPTYGNIVAGVKALIRKAKPGDQVYIHYSGHGAAVQSLIPDLKSNGLDEALVPTNIGNTDSRFLRDLEMAKLLQTMAEHQLVVTMVLDSCHSAGMTRGPDARVRGLGEFRSTNVAADSLVASIDELAETWRQVSEGTTRSLSTAGWSPASAGAIVLSACGPTELAYEYAFDGSERNGALTYWFLNSLGELGLKLTYKQLHDRVMAKVHNQFASQTPHLEGDGERIVFGVDRVPATYAAVVTAVDAGKNEVLLNVGQAQGVRRGSEFAIHSLIKRDLNDPDGHLGVATIEVLGATDSSAKFTSATATIEAVEQGDQAVLINPGSINLVKNVRLLEEPDKATVWEQHRPLLDSIAEAIEHSPWLKLVEGKTPASYQVAIGKEGGLEIIDASGKALTREVPIAANSKDVILKRLEHLTKYHTIEELDNHDTRSPLARKLSVEWAGSQHEFEYGEKPEPVPFDSKTPVVKADEWVSFRIKNLSENLLRVVVLDLQPDWGISQVHPEPPLLFLELEAGCEELVILRAGLPDGYCEGRDILKVFASLDSANFRWLELPALDSGAQISKNKNRQPSGLDLLLDALSDDKPKMRNLSPAAYPSRGWTTTQIEINVIR
ncbi:MAG TPA: caspase family protein [Pyrinomonadaceae bacterium]|nr:caspase family protein [Pyrinomonadaceae bacterium]